MKKRVVICIISAVTFFVIAGFSLLTGNPLAGSVTVEAGTRLTMQDFYTDERIYSLLEHTGLHLINVKDLTGLDSFKTDTPGEFPIQFLVNGEARTVKLIVTDTVAPEADITSAVIRAGVKCKKSDIIKKIYDSTSVKTAVGGLKKYNKSLKAGIYPVKIVLKDAAGNKTDYTQKIYAIPLKKSLHIELGGSPAAAEDFLTEKPDWIKSISYEDGFLISDYSDKPGKYSTDLLIKGEDNGESFKVTVSAHFNVSDTKKPEIVGAEDIEIYAGQTPTYRKNVFVRDNQSEPVKLVVDSDSVDKRTPGKYTVTYSAVDDAGNKAKKKITLTVIPASENHTGDVKKYVKKTLKKIITDDMSDKEKLWAIWYWCHENITYTGQSDKGNPVEAAYLGFKTHHGDCYTYYAVADALITGAGFDDMMVSRKGGYSHHFWNLVKYKGEWYHFDSCPLMKGETFVPFLLSDHDLLAFSKSYGKRYPDKEHQKYYYFDRNLYPERGKTSPE